MWKPLIALAVLSLIAAGCEDTAASRTFDLELKEISAQDVADGKLVASIPMTGGSCDLGPCEPNPCADPARQRCLAQGDQFICECNAGTHPEQPMEMPDAEPVCVEDESCEATTCNGHGTCMEMDDNLICECERGYTGPNCTECDADDGFTPDGFGACASDVPVCRVREDDSDWAEFIADAEESLGHAPNELEISAVRVEVVDGSERGVRNWPFLLQDEVTVFVQPVSGFPLDAAVADVPTKDDGLTDLPMDILVGRPALTENPEYLEGQFDVGVRGPTELHGTEMFAVDLLVHIEMNAY